MGSGMRHSFWYGGCGPSDLSWLDEAVQSLHDNSWDGETTLYFDGAKWSDKVRQDAAVSLLAALGKNTSAKSVYLRNASLDETAQVALEELFTTNKHLESVTLRNFRSENSVMELPGSLLENPALRALSLSGVALGGSFCEMMSARLSGTEGNVSSVYLEQVSVDEAFEACCHSIGTSKSLRKLTLKNMHLTENQMESLLTAVGHNTSLTRLHLEGLRLGVNHANSIANMIARNEHLEELSLRKNQLAGEDVGIIFERGVANHQMLHTLFLSHNPVGDSGARLIVRELVKNVTLRRLCLSNCEIWAEGCKAIARGLKHMSGLRDLNLDCNDFEVCADHVLDSLRNGNDVLQNVAQQLPLLVANAFGDLDDEEVKIWKKIDLHLQWNKAGRSILRSELADAVMGDVLARSSSTPDVLFLFLQNQGFTQ